MYAGGAMIDPALEAKNLIHCFDPDVSHVEGNSEILVLSPRWGRLRRSHPLLASTAACHGPGCAWLAAREKLLTSRDLSIQLAIATYGHRIRVRACLPVELLRDPNFDLHQHCHRLLDRCGDERKAVVVRREAFWIRSLPPNATGMLQFEFGNTFLIPITASAIAEEGKIPW